MVVRVAVWRARRSGFAWEGDGMVPRVWTGSTAAPRGCDEVCIGSARICVSNDGVVCYYFVLPSG
jgi:hypothetical protein